jgi:hypothetical protein
MTSNSETCFTPGEQIIKKLPDISEHSPVTVNTMSPCLSGCSVQQHSNIWISSCVSYRLACIYLTALINKVLHHQIAYWYM